MESHASVFRSFQRRTTAGTSARDSDAAITTAARAGCGRFFRSPGTATSSTTIAPAPTRPATWVLAPACSATAVRDPLVLTGNPWNNPAATFAAPIPIISWFPCTRSPARDANADAVEIVSASATNTMPNAPASRRERSENETSGIVNGGNPLGSGPTTDTPFAVRSNTSTARIARTTATRTAGTFGIARCRTRIRTSAPTPTANAAATVSPAVTPSTNAFGAPG